VQRYDAELRQDARKSLEAAVRASSGNKDGLITVEVDDEDPKFAAQLDNAHVEELQKLLARLAVTEAQQRRVFFEKQLQQAKDNLTRAEQALKASGVNSSALKASPQAAVEAVARLRAAITAQEIKIASLRGYLSENAPDFRQALTELGAMRAQLARAEQQEAPVAGGSDYIGRYRDFKYYETLFELFAKQYELARVDESREGAVIQVLDAAQPPERKSKPKRALVAITASLSTLAVLLVGIFGLRALHKLEQDPEAESRLVALRQAWRGRS
jgi:capsule polysaccharide export protein KpsE/RkpR